MGMEDTMRELVMENNPYSAPVPSSPYEVSRGGASMVSAAAVAQLAATKPWVRLISVVIFVGAGFMLLGALFMLMAGGASMMAAAKSQGAPSALAGSMGGILAALYAVLAFLYIFPGLKLWKYASAIGRLIQSGGENDLVDALNQQRSFWKFTGMIVLIMLVIYIVAIIVGIAAVGFAAAAASGAKP